MWFLNDEPELTEYNHFKNECGTGYRIPCDEKKFAGIMATIEIGEHAASLRNQRPNVPMTVNLGMGPSALQLLQLGARSVDILQTDNYY